MNFGDSTNTFTLTTTPTKQQTSNNILSYSSCLQPTNLLPTPNSTHITTPPPDSYAAAHRRQLYAREGSHVHWDPHLTCLHLGKRHYFEDVTIDDVSKYNNNGNNVATLGKPHVCRVGGGVVISGSRHVGADDGDITLGNRHVYGGDGGAGYFLKGNDKRARGCHGGAAGCALSLLSFESSDNWCSHDDLSTRCSAALRELIAENRAALMTRQQQQHVYVVPHHDDDAVDEEELEFVEIQPESNYFPQHMFSQTQ
ncbi:uncharacterized protein HKW66_Vig0255160 [Vigna angularis]|uniref:Uncharacterized protein n=1 Tax=Phaseolus angularis TaxID=3914 RepID=A0A8T0JWE9_PHAAN|nr:uncharacterized protein HKW66_Vig0255160 [Vigna angularis]